jgi:hypothetical protein
MPAAAASDMSCSAKAEHPVNTASAVSTGSSGCADDDGEKAEFVSDKFVRSQWCHLRSQTHMPGTRPGMTTKNSQVPANAGTSERSDYKITD